MAVWRLHVNTSGNKIAKYCLDNHVAAMGWSLDDIAGELRDAIVSFDDFRTLADAKYDNYSSVKRLVYDVKPDDLIWMRSAEEGQYYIGRVTENGHWVFNKTATDKDAANQLTDIDWLPASGHADEESVPGAVATSFILGSTLQRIKKSGVEEYSRLLYNDLKKECVYKITDLKFNADTFYNLLSPEDAEDLAAMWLYKTRGYITIPSSNKRSTPAYECVLLDPSSSVRKHIYIQVKKGEKPLNAADYCHLNGEVYLLTTKGSRLNAGEYPNVFFVDPEELFDFAVSQENQHILPESIYFWGKFLSEHDSSNRNMSGAKGIIFDTNRTYSGSNEDEMLKEHKVSAYGSAKRYIRSFNTGDYALLYSKGRGITAVGRILSETLENREKDELYRKVEWVAPKADYGASDSIKAVSAHEIRELLNKNFFWASTIKAPFLDLRQVNILAAALNERNECT